MPVPKKPSTAHAKADHKPEAKVEAKSKLPAGEREAVETLIAQHEAAIADLKERL